MRVTNQNKKTLKQLSFKVFSGGGHGTRTRHHSMHW
nr:MAG TPA: hypothetical protein [Caudoviricetes sp.]